MLSKIARILEPIVLDPAVKMVVLYRIDGTPIISKFKERDPRVLSILYWLENQIRDAILHLLNEDLDDLSFKFKDVVIRMRPVSKTLVLALMAEEDLSLYKLDADIESVCREIRGII